MAEQRDRLTNDQVLFEVRFAVGQVPKAVWVRVRGKDRLASDAAIDEVARAIAGQFHALEVVRVYDPDERNWGNMFLRR